MVHFFSALLFWHYCCVSLLYY